MGRLLWGVVVVTVDVCVRPNLHVFVIVVVEDGPDAEEATDAEEEEEEEEEEEGVLWWVEVNSLRRFRLCLVLLDILPSNFSRSAANLAAMEEAPPGEDNSRLAAGIVCR